MQSRVDNFDLTQKFQSLHNQIVEAQSKTQEKQHEIHRLQKDKENLDAKIESLEQEKTDLRTNVSKMRYTQGELESKYASQSKEMNLLQTKLVKQQEDGFEAQSSELQRTIRELEGEVNLLSLREKEFEAAIRQRDEELAKQRLVRKQLCDRGTQTNDMQ